MDCEVANEIISRLIGFSVNFKYFDQTIYITENISVTLSSSLSYMCEGSSDSYFKIAFNPFDYLPNISFGIFDIKPRAKEFGMKLKGFIDEGEVFVNASFDTIKIAVNVYKVVGSDCTDTGSVTIAISLPNNGDGPYEDEEEEEAYEMTEERKDAENIKKAFGIGALAVGGIILAKVIKGGIGAILGGPVGAAIGFAT